MRNDWRVRAAVLLGSVLAVASCSTTQPESVGERTASLTIVATATVDIFNCYEIWADDGSGTLVYQGFNECYQVFLPQQPPLPRRELRPVPWHYSITISIIHKNSTVEEIVTSLSGVVGTSAAQESDFTSMTKFDPSDQPADFRPPEDRPGYVGPVQFLNGKQVSRGSPFWLGPAGFPLEEPNILTLPTSFDFEVNSGDTVIVRARKQTFADSSGFLPLTPNPGLQLSGELTIGGNVVTPSGTKISSTADGSGISFSFTVQ